MAEVAEEKTLAHENKPEDSNVPDNGEKTVDDGGVKLNVDAHSGVTAEPSKDTTGPVEPTEDAAESAKDVNDAGNAEQKQDDEVDHSSRKRHSTSERFAPKRLKVGHQRKSRFDELPESDNADDIRHQVEFYFSDSNLPVDKFLLESTGGHKNLPVELKVIHSFKRMQHFQPYSAVRDAVAESSYLHLNENDEITRTIPLDEKFSVDDVNGNRELLETGSMPRSIYAKGFGSENKSTHLDIEAFFEPYGPLNGVRLRRHLDGAFKGSVFVEFANEEAQHAFLALDPKPKWDDKDLEIMSKKQYVDMKNEAILNGTVRPRSQTRQSSGGKKFGGNFSGRSSQRKDGGRPYKKDGHRSRDGDRIDKDDWKKRRDRDQEDDKRDRRHHHDNRSRKGRHDRSDGPKRRREDDDEEDNREDREEAHREDGREDEKKRKRGGEEREEDEVHEAKKADEAAPDAEKPGEGAEKAIAPVGSD